MPWWIILGTWTCLLPAQELTPREKLLLEKIEQLEKRVAALEQQTRPQAAGLDNGAPATATPSAALPANAAVLPPPDPPQNANGGLFGSGVTMSMTLDGYYLYNFNRPVGGVNLLRAYDVTSNSFNLNQATVIIERAPDVQAGRRVGGRLDLQFGQATDTLQGNPANESRPQIYRNVFQAYGTYVAPLGKGLTVDFGKFASSFGIENNYTKDQLNYSRSYFFNFLPFYHMGFRTTYPVSNTLNVSYWLTNGLNQTEDFNGFKSQAVLINGNPSAKLSWNLNYYNGQEQRAWGMDSNPTLPIQPGLSVTPVPGGVPHGRTHLFDAYVTWKPTERLALAAEADTALTRRDPDSAPLRVTGGATYVQYRLLPRLSVAGRFTALSDHGGWFSGVDQSLREATVTTTFNVADGLQMKWEYRRDWSNHAYFLTGLADQRKREQDTALLGLVWWFGGKSGVW